MDSGVSVRASGATPPTVVRTDPPAQKESTRTELSSAKAVTAAQNSEKTRNDARALQEQQKRVDSYKNSLDKNIELDPESHEVITKFRDPDSGHVVKQIPEEATLKLQAYVRQLVNEKHEAQQRQATEKRLEVTA